MKINAKILKPVLLSVAAIVLVVTTVFATMAYLTSSAAVSNVFTVGDVKLHMYETKVLPNGKPDPANPVVPGEMKNTDTNSYHLVPGGSYLKDPTIYVDGGSEESYLFVRLRNDLKSIEKPGATTILSQLKQNGWLEIQRDPNNIDAVFVYVGEDVSSYANAAAYFDAVDNEGNRKNNKAKLVGGVANREEYNVFKNFTLADEVPNLSSFGGARVAIVAYAIQANLPGYNATEVVGTQSAVTHAWEYIKAELPFVV